MQAVDVGKPGNWELDIFVIPILEWLTVFESDRAGEADPSPEIQQPTGFIGRAGEAVEDKSRWIDMCAAKDRRQISATDDAKQFSGRGAS